MANWEEFRLWDHQLSAIKCINKYFSSGSEKSCLIRMPTGTGKTGVIATISQFVLADKTPLILSPYRSLSNQIEREVSYQFWEKLEVNKEKINKGVVNFKPSTLDLESIREDSAKIYLSTIQSFYSISANQKYSELFDALKDKISYVIFDEGHRKPAPKWADAIKALGKPLILFSATPYRNDFKLFGIDENFRHSFTYQDALKKNIIRDVEFKPVEFNNEENFVDSIIEHYDEIKSSSLEISGDHKVIIRCSSRDSVVRIAAELDKRDYKVIGIHEEADNSRHYLTKQVPDPKDVDYTFWIHQNKLLEGFDEPNLCLLGIYNNFSNARSLVQQVGRIIRNPSRSRNQVARVIYKSGSNQEEFWDGYRFYEEHYSPEDTLELIIKKILEAQPKVIYLKDRYRKALDISEKEIHNKFHYPKRANVFRIRDEFILEDLAEKIHKEYEEKGITQTQLHLLDEDKFFIPFINFDFSDLILEGFFYESKVGFAIGYKCDDYFFFQDTNNSIPDELIESGDLSLIGPERFSKLFSGNDSRAASVTLVNTDIGQHSIRRRSIHARSLLETAPSLTDHAYYCSNIKGTASSNIGYTSRYLGFKNARISDYTPSQHDFESYIEWLDSINETLTEDDVRLNTVFNRYAMYIDPPANKEPLNILLDINENICDSFELIDKKSNDEGRLELENLCYDIEENKFILRANEEDFKVNIEYSETKNKYILDSDELENSFKIKDGATISYDRGIISYLNAEQSFRIIPDTNSEKWIIYAHRNFYTPRLALGGSDEKLELLNIFSPYDVFNDVTSEKGNKQYYNGNERENWEDGSIFNLLDLAYKKESESTKLNDYLGKYELVICDDYGNSEVADFIAADFGRKKIQFIHAKFKDGGELSASSFQEVSMQATKNLTYLTPYNTDSPPNVEKWNGPWNAMNGSVRERIRKNSTNIDSGQEIWEELRKLIIDPNANKEVVIAFGSGFSISKLRSEINNGSEDTVPEAIQLIYLIHSTWVSAESSGIKLKIWCPDL